MEPLRKKARVCRSDGVDHKDRQEQAANSVAKDCDKQKASKSEPLKGSRGESLAKLELAGYYTKNI